MSRINTNVQSLLAQRVLGQNNAQLNESLQRLSTGLRINSGADDPAGLIASERLRSEKASLSAAIGNAERADQVINVAEGGLQEISTLLTELQSLVGQSGNDAGLSADEKQANQLQIDSILGTIDRISEATSFQGTKLLNGSFDYTVSGVATTVADFQINGAKLATDENRDVQVVVTQSAQRAGLFLSLGAANLDLTAATDQFTFEVAGTEGSREFSFASGTTAASIVDTINTFKSVTGVSAATSGTGIVLKTTGYGSDEFVSIDVVDDAGQGGDGVLTLSTTDENTATTASGTAFSAIASPIRDDGQDVGAIVNGVAANSDGLVAKVANEFLDIELELTAAGATTPGAISALTVTGGGAKFNLGPNVDIGNQVGIGIGNVAARKLGSFTNGYLNSLASGADNNVVDGDLETGQKIVNDAINQISSLRGRLGAFQKNTIGATVRNLSVALENTSAVESAIRDTDFAAETAELTRSQILSQAATNALSIANSQPQSALALLG